MTRESRLIVVLLVISAIGVSALTFVANQYRKTLSAHPVPARAAPESASLRAARLVDGFLAARRAVKVVVAGDFSEAAVGAYRVARDQALSTHRMTREDYAEVRAAWRALSDGLPGGDKALVAALAARSTALEEAALGLNEALDDAIK